MGCSLEIRSCVKILGFGFLGQLSIRTNQSRRSIFALNPKISHAIATVLPEIVGVGAQAFLISTPESAPAGIAAPVPVGSGPELSHKTTEPQRCCRACGTCLHGLNAPGNNLPIRHVPTPRRSASDRPLDLDQPNRGQAFDFYDFSPGQCA